MKIAKKIFIISIVFLFGALILLGIYSTIRDAKIVRLIYANQGELIGLSKEEVMNKIGKPKSFQNLGAVNKDGKGEIHEMLYYSAGKTFVSIHLKDDIVEEIDFYKVPSLKSRKRGIPIQKLSKK